MSESNRAAVEAIVGASAAVLDALPRAIAVIDSDGFIVAWNAVAERFYGWSADEARDRNLLELVCSPELRARGAEMFAGVLEGHPWNGRVQTALRSGSSAWTYSFLAPLRDADGRIVGAVAAADDAGELDRLRQEKSDLADHLLLALGAGELGTWRWELQTGVTFWDATTERLFGFEPGGFGGTYEDYVSSLHPEDLEQTLAVVALAVAERSSYNVEHRVVWRDGTTHWLQGRGKVTTDDEGNATGTIGCVSDITDRKLAEANAARRTLEAERIANTERRGRERMEFLAGLNDIAISSGSWRDLMQRAAGAAVPRLGDWCSVHFTPQPGSNETVDAHVDPERVAWAQRARTLHPYDPAAPFGIPAVMRSGRTEFWPVIDLAAAKELMTHTEGFDPGDLAEILDQLGVTSLMTIPLMTKRGVVGVIQFASAESRRQFDEYDLALAEAAAGRIAEALDNAWLLEQQRTIASTLQAALLPDRLPDLPGITIAARYWAAGAVSEVGGDFYDVFPIGDRRWAVVIGDVCGTGPRAAAVTAVARHTIRAAATHGEDHVSVLTWVNDAILNGDSDLFCTVLYATLELLDDGTWTFTSAAGGHPLPVLVAPDGSASSIGPYGTLIGVLPVISVTPTSTILRPGSTIMLHTDGVNDVAPPHDLDEQALEQLVASAAAAGGTADDIAERIGDSIASTLPIPDRDDDVAIVVITLD